MRNALDRKELLSHQKDEGPEMIQVMIHATSAYSSDYIKDKCDVGLTDQFKTRWPMERRKSHPATSEQMDSFKNRPGRVPWPWEQGVVHVG